MSLKIADARVKELLGHSSLSNPEWVRPYFPDWVEQINSTLVIIEYENSSRGMLTHVSKYLKLSRDNSGVTFDVHLVESQHHQANHRQDRELSMFLATLRSSNITFTFHACNGSEDALIRVRDDAVIKKNRLVY
jgi:hypothetical protein